MERSPYAGQDPSHSARLTSDASNAQVGNAATGVRSYIERNPVAYQDASIYPGNPAGQGFSGQGFSGQGFRAAGSAGGSGNGGGDKGRKGRKDHSARAGAGPRRLLLILTSLVCLLAGLVIGVFVLSRFVDLPLRTVASTLSESQLDSTIVGTYTYEGTVYQITARQAIEDSVSLTSRLTDSGSYLSPSSDMILSYARNAILSQEVAARGITVTDSDLQTYLATYAGNTDLATVAAQYSMDEDQARRLMIEAAGVMKLRQQVTGSTTDTSAIAAPVAPADGNSETTNQAYALYIIGLLGANWDSVNNTWANTTNAFYLALQNAVFTAAGANYEAAEIAYSVAVSLQAQTGATGTSGSSGTSGTGNDQWISYVNTLLSEGAITIYTLQA